MGSSEAQRGHRVTTAQAAPLTHCSLRVPRAEILGQAQVRAWHWEDTSRGIYSSSGCGLHRRGDWSLWWGTDSVLPGSFSESSLGLGTGWNLSRTGGVKMEAFTDEDGISSGAAGLLQTEVLCRRHRRHGFGFRRRTQGQQKNTPRNPGRVMVSLHSGRWKPLE